MNAELKTFKLQPDDKSQFFDEKLTMICSPYSKLVESCKHNMTLK